MRHIDEGSVRRRGHTRGATLKRGHSRRDGVGSRIDHPHTARAADSVENRHIGERPVRRNGHPKWAACNGPRRHRRDHSVGGSVDDRHVVGDRICHVGERPVRRNGHTPRAPFPTGAVPTQVFGAGLMTKTCLESKFATKARAPFGVIAPPGGPTPTCPIPAPVFGAASTPETPPPRFATYANGAAPAVM